jgi:hypothetical protein
MSNYPNIIPPASPVLCKCSRPAEAYQIDLHRMFPRLVPHPLCDACQGISDARAGVESENLRQRTEKDRRQARLHAVIPPALRDTHLGHPAFNKSLYIRCQDWSPGPRWLGVVGPPGSCKTRIVAGIASRCILDLGYFVTWTTLPGLQTTTEILRIGTDREKQDALKFLHRCRTADLLVLDDFGKNTWNPSLERAVFEILDHRGNHYLPVLWTANTSLLDILRNREISSDRAAPIIGRILDNSRIEQSLR